MLYPIVVPVRNNVSLTRKAVRTFKAQDIGEVTILVVNNQSTDGTNAYLAADRDILQMYFDPPLSVAASWNRALQFFFKAGAEYVLVVNNDVELRPDTYRHLVADRGAFVTAVGTTDPEKIKPLTVEQWRDEHYRRQNFTPTQYLPLDQKYLDPDPTKTRPHPDFSAYLIRKEAYETVGPFDEHFGIAFCEDWDYHVRMHRAGIVARSIDLPFLHHGSMTIKMADLAEVRKIQMQAEKNREYFKKKWGFAGASDEYYRYFGESNPG